MNVGLLTMEGLKRFYLKTLKVSDYNRVELLTQISALMEWFKELPEDDFVFTSRNTTKKYEGIKLIAMAQNVLNQGRASSGVKTK